MFYFFIFFLSLPHSIYCCFKTELVNLKFQSLMFPNRDDGRYSVSEDGTLRIAEVTYDDAGVYKCEALNIRGQAAASAKVQVRGEFLLINTGSHYIDCLTRLPRVIQKIIAVIFAL